VLRAITARKPARAHAAMRSLVANTAREIRELPARAVKSAPVRPGRAVRKPGAKPKRSAGPALKRTRLPEDDTR